MNNKRTYYLGNFQSEKIAARIYDIFSLKLRGNKAILNNGNISLQSIPNIHQNKYFTCLEYYELNLSAQFEIKICYNLSKCNSTYIFDTNFLNFKPYNSDINCLNLTLII